MQHIPVLMSEVLDSISPRNNCVYFDGTFGGGGYSKAILESANCRVIAVDRDPYVASIADAFKKEYGERFSFVCSKYSNLPDILCRFGIEKVDGIVLDLGVSSFQLDDASRGFSFSKEGDLDMRMSQSGPTALETIHVLSESQLADIIYLYGEERFSRRIAKALKKNLQEIRTTCDMARIIRSVIHGRFSKDPATKTFQALRIYVNDELGELQNLLDIGANYLNSNGVFSIVSFHSLEDRLVKFRFKELALDKQQFCLLSKKPIVPSVEEIRRNIRSRSAKLRALRRL